MLGCGVSYVQTAQQQQQQQGFGAWVQLAADCILYLRAYTKATRPLIPILPHHITHTQHIPQARSSNSSSTCTWIWCLRSTNSSSLAAPSSSNSNSREGRTGGWCVCLSWFECWDMYSGLSPPGWRTTYPPIYNKSTPAATNATTQAPLRLRTTHFLPSFVKLVATQEAKLEGMKRAEQRKVYICMWVYVCVWDCKGTE